MFGFILPLAFALLPLFSFPLGGGWTYLPLIAALVGLPIFDFILPKAKYGKTNGPKWFFNAILYAYSLYHVFLIVWVGKLLINSHPTWSEVIGIILSTGVITGGIGITFAHELVHRRNRLERLLGELILVFVCYGQFRVAHVWGHHRNVGTPADPATAKKGQSIYRFYLQAVPGVFLDALKIRQNLTLIYTTISLLIAVSFALWGGAIGIVYFLGQSAFAALLLETIDYIEHYGLKRKEIAPGRYEAVKAEHSWDSSALLSNYLLLHLQRHSDHHLHVLKEYPDLEIIPQAAQLPTGYPGLLILALIPPLWFKIMDKRLPLPR